MPAGGLPVASITISTACEPIAESASSVMQVVPWRSASSSERAAYCPAGQPTRCRLGPGAFRIEIRDRGEMDARRTPDLREKHRAEFPRPDEGDAQRFSFGRTLEQETMEVHVSPGKACPERYHRRSRHAGCSSLRSVWDTSFRRGPVPTFARHRQKAMLQSAAQLEPSAVPLWPSAKSHHLANVRRASAVSRRGVLDGRSVAVRSVRAAAVRKKPFPDVRVRPGDPAQSRGERRGAASLRLYARRIHGSHVERHAPPERGRRAHSDVVRSEPFPRHCGLRRHIKKSGDVFLADVVVQDVLFEGRRRVSCCCST